MSSLFQSQELILQPIDYKKNNNNILYNISVEKLL